ncbi:MAG: NAD-dependent epimerase/dehydratase family protein [Gemmatimonadota bacterium]
MILVTGATGYTGRVAVPRLRALGEPLRLLVRASSQLAGLETAGVEIVTGDLERPAEVERVCRGIERIAHLAHIRHAPALAAALGDGVRHVVLLSSAWRHSRVPSSAADAVRCGEEAVARSAMPWTILRPTMIYGPGDDRNISRLADRVRQGRWVPIFGSGEQLHQPVHVEDVVGALVTCLALDRATGRAYDLAGAAPLSYRELVRCVGAAVGVRPRMVRVPVAPALGAARVAEWLGLRLPVTAEQVRRSQESRACDIEPARADLGFSPASFSEGLARIFGNRGREGRDGDRVTGV